LGLSLIAEAHFFYVRCVANPNILFEQTKHERCSVLPERMRQKIGTDATACRGVPCQSWNDLNLSLGRCDGWLLRRPPKPDRQHRRTSPHPARGGMPSCRLHATGAYGVRVSRRSPAKPTSSKSPETCYACYPRLTPFKTHINAPQNENNRMGRRGTSWRGTGAAGREVIGQADAKSRSTVRHFRR
jgi:hypothetical protein